jgi:hypothetical protein
VVGGRGSGNVNEQDAGVQLVSDGTPSTFQGRYLIRHYWTGTVTCEAPRFERWGGPPDAPYVRNLATPAKGLATAPRGKVALRSEVRSPVPLLGIAGTPPPVRRKPAP